MLTCEDCKGEFQRKSQFGPTPRRCYPCARRRTFTRQVGFNKARRHSRVASGLRPSKGRQHGLADEEYRALVADAHCAICKGTETGWDRGWHIDHDHACCPGGYSCGKCVRGLLCHNCNLALGHIKDDPAVAEAMALYLRGNHGQA